MCTREALGHFERTLYWIFCVLIIITELQGTLTVKNGRIHDLKEELEITKAELSTAMESATKSK